VRTSDVVRNTIAEFKAGVTTPRTPLFIHPNPAHAERIYADLHRDGGGVRDGVAREEEIAAHPRFAQRLEQLWEPGTQLVGELDHSGELPVDRDVCTQSLAIGHVGDQCTRAAACSR